MIKSREYRGKIDNEYITTFLQSVYNINKDQQCWLTPRFHYGIYFANPLIQYKNDLSAESTIRIWQTEEGQIVGIVNKEDAASTFIQIHPDYMFIQEQMVKWIDENKHLYLYEEEGIRSIKIWCNDKRTSLKDSLSTYGYKKHECLEFEHQMWQTLDKEIPKYNLPDGYSICSFEDELDIEKRIQTYTKAFNIDDIPVKVYHQMQKSPLYRKDLDLVVVYKEDIIASFCTVWFDEKNGIGVFEPVGTHPEHQRKGLCRAMMLQALKLLKNLECKTVYLSAYGKEEVIFYESVGFFNYDVAYPWIKKLNKL